MRLRFALCLPLIFGSPACTDELGSGFSLAGRGMGPASLRLGEHVPRSSEAAAVGASRGRVVRDSAEFSSLAPCEAAEVVFKDEEGTGADRLMTPRLAEPLARLGRLVGQRWPGLRVRVTEAWDERGEHGAGSLHYEGRAADMTTSDRDPEKLGELAALAVQAGFEWVYYEDRTHVHASVRP